MRCRIFLTLLALLGAGCGWQAGELPVPMPQVFTSPAEDLSAAARFSSGVLPNHFGASVDIEGDLLVAGAPKWGYPGEGAGAAYVYRHSTQGEWREEAALLAGDRDDGFQYDQHFGEAVALNGTLIAVGAPGSDDPVAGDNTGAVYLFEHDGSAWVQTARLAPARPLPEARIGSSLAFAGELLAAAGAPGAGSVNFFRREPGGWRELPPLPIPAAPDGKPLNVLMDLYGDTLAISTVAWQEPKSEEELELLRTTGTVTLYARDGDGWEQTFQTHPQEASLFRMREEGPFGISVALGGKAGKASWLAVGRPGFTGSGRESGSVAIYERGRRGWALQAELALAPGQAAPGSLPFFGPDPGPVFFGAFVELEGDQLGVISTFANTAYVFERQGKDWIYRARVTPGAAGGDDFMRRTLALSGDRLLLGSPGDLGGGFVTVFELAP